MFKKGNRLWDNPNSKRTQFKKGIISHNKGKNKENCEYLRKISERMRINNPMKNAESLRKSKLNRDYKKIGEKISETRKKLFKEGKMSIWIKGKTKETDKRVRKISERMRINNPIFKNKSLQFHKGNKIWELKKKFNHPIEERKKISASNQGISLENWEKFTSFEPYTSEFNKEFKNLVRLRDNFCCLNCGISEQKHIFLFNQKLTIHHIDYNKHNTCLNNCCTLCKKCNSLANKNRVEWTEYYQEKLSKLYNYQYERLMTSPDHINPTPVYCSFPNKIEIKYINETG